VLCLFLQKPLNLWQISVAGAFAGLLNCVIVTPVELIKTRLQIQHEAAKLLRSPLHSLPKGAATAAAEPLFHGPLDCVSKIYAKNGLKGLFRGMSATMYREIPGYAGQFFCYEALKRSLTREGELVQDLGAVPLILAGGSAGIFGWLMSYPMDYVKSQIQAEPYDVRTPYKKNPYLFDGGFISAWKQTVRAGGHKALWRGFGTCAARAFPANAAGFLAYEFSLNMIRDLDAQ
jgi:solute carrier family 25 carnitine/acylcarnitine transporter 20/29